MPSYNICNSSYKRALGLCGVEADVVELQDLTDKLRMLNSLGAIVVNGVPVPVPAVLRPYLRRKGQGAWL